MDAVSRIEKIISPSLDALGYSLVQVRMADGSRRKTLSIMAERKDEAIMSFDDCVEITNAVSALLDVEETVEGAYSLEVCSPGLDRPLVKREDFSRFAGNEIKAESMIPIGGRKRFRGKLMGVEGETVKIKSEEGNFEIPYSHVRSAKLVATDEIFASFLKKQGTKKKAKSNQ